jgi:hypothetical protein
MQASDYPALQQAADQASLDGQSKYLWSVRLDLAFVVLGAATGSIAAFWPPDQQTGPAVVTAVLLVSSVVAKLATRVRHDDWVWFDGRAVAESVKTATWRYMMRAEPFASDATCDREFTQQLTAAREERPELPLAIGRLTRSAQQITNRMREVRQQPLPERRAFYLTDRLDDQATWYQQKATAAQRSAMLWFVLGLLAQVAAVALAVGRVAGWLPSLNPIGVLTALAAAFTAWSQLGRHDELGRSYALAFDELLTMKELVGAAMTNAGLAERVYDAENAISREHTLWIAKRTGSLPRSAGRTPQR